jgi:macrolide-specific efflux system membrane fusion protein
MAGMTADVFFVLEKAERAVTIPASLVVKPNNKGMQKLKVLHADGKLETRDVRIGLRNADKAQVTAMITRLLKLPAAPKPADAADALALALCHLWRSPMQGRLLAAAAKARMAP